MRVSNGVRALVGVVAAVMMLACSVTPKDEVRVEDPTVSTVAMNDDTCKVDHTTLSGKLTSNNIEEALKQAKKLKKKGKSGKHGSGNNESTITSICGSHQYSEPNKPRLDLGQFVAVIDIKGEDTKYSPEKNDVVYIWIYKDSTDYAAQFLSTKLKDLVSSDSPRMKHCEKSPPTGEEAHWTAGNECAEAGALAMLNQHTPWWGCWLGCCYVSDT
jgi:hypothetical protein